MNPPLAAATYVPSTARWNPSPGFADEWRAECESLAERFGRPAPGSTCPESLFVAWLPGGTVAVVRATDAAGPLRFHFLAIDGRLYRDYRPDPFAWADDYPVDWHAGGDPADPELVEFAPDRRTAATLEPILRDGDGPLLLAAAQVLVDGGKLFLVRPAPEPKTVREVWSLLPYSTQSEVRPCTFAYSAEIGCDLLIVPEGEPPPGYLTEDQTLDYPEARFERNLQYAIEHGDESMLRSLLGRRSSAQTLRLAIRLVIAAAVVSLAVRLLTAPGVG